MTTVSAHIERHSWLERQEAHFGHTMVIIHNFLFKDRVLLDKNLLKMTIVRSLKILDFNGTPAFQGCLLGSILLSILVAVDILGCLLGI